MGISCWIAHKAVWSPQNTATVYRERVLTYKELESWIASLAGYLAQDLGVRGGDRIAYLGRNSDVIVALFFACARIGAIFVPLNSRLTAEQLDVMVGNAEPHYLFAAQGFREVAKACTSASAAEVISIANGATGPETTDLVELPTSIQPIQCDPNRDQNIPVLIAYTSGTTGTPKGAVYTQDAITFSAINSNNCWNMRGTDHVLTYLPMFHVGGFLIHTLPAFHIGAKVSIVEDFSPGEVLQWIATEDVTLIMSPPHFSRAMLNHPEWESSDLSSLRCVGIGSTFVPPEVMLGWMDRNIPTQQNYGLTEGVPVLGVPFAHHRRKAGTAGLAMLYCQARVMDDNMNRLPPGKAGEVMVRGRSIFSGYWRNPEADKMAFREGWFLTGDIAFTDDEGYFHIIDRKKNIVIVGSSNVYPADLEKILEECPNIAEAAVVGCPDSETGEALVACIRPVDGKWRDEEAVRSLFEGKLAPYQYPKHVLFMESFPRTSLGKVQKVALADQVRRVLDIT